jgi:hypothetical protein
MDFASSNASCVACSGPLSEQPRPQWQLPGSLPRSRRGDTGIPVGTSDLLSVSVAIRRMWRNKRFDSTSCGYRLFWGRRLPGFRPRSRPRRTRRRVTTSSGRCWCTHRLEFSALVPPHPGAARRSTEPRRGVDLLSALEWITRIVSHGCSSQRDSIKTVAR